MDTIRRPEHPLSSPGFPSYLSLPRSTVRGLWTSLLWSSLATMGCALEVGAQDGALRGIVNTAEKKPLPEARVSVVGTPLVTVSDTDGTFRIVALPSGSQAVEVKMFGYGPSLLLVEIVAGKTATLEVTLSPVAAPLETVNVMADTMIVPGMRGFQERKARGTGKFFTREDIERMQARLFTDVLRRVPGMQVQRVNSSYGAGYSVQTGRTQSINGGRVCPVLFYINGAPFPMLGDVPINNFISPEEVAAVEVYTGASQLPPQFNSSMYNSRCGVVVIWTRTSNDPTRSR
jgi:TonB-dependent starch-binding outer membrane protein SusC